MAAALGSTTDPKALVPGDVGAIMSTVDSLRGKANGIEDAGTALGKVDVGGWTGAGSDAFTGRLGAEPPKWFKSSDALTSAVDAVTGYADTLSWAQAQAAEAIDLWERGEAATRAAAAKATDSAEAVLTSPLLDPAGADPGAALREQARELLSRARKQLKEAGDEAAGGLGKPFTVDAGPLIELGRRLLKPPLGDDSQSIEARGENGWAKLDWFTKGPHTEHGNGKAGAYLAQLGFDAKGNFHGIDFFGKGDAGIGAEAGASAKDGDATAFARAGAWGTLDAGLGYGPASLRNHLEAFAGAEGNAYAHAGLDGVSAGASGFAGARISDELTGKLGLLEGTVGGNASAGAEAHADAGIGAEGVHAGAGAFAGAKAGVDAGGSFAGIGANVGVEGRAGVGEDVGFGATHENGKISFDLNAGAALGLGAGGHAEVTVDTNQVADAAGDVADGAKRLAGKVTPW